VTNLTSPSAFTGYSKGFHAAYKSSPPSYACAARLEMIIEIGTVRASARNSAFCRRDFTRSLCGEPFPQADAYPLLQNRARRRMQGFITVS